MSKFNAWLQKELRKSSYKWLPRRQALHESKIARGKYVCAHCKNVFGPKDVDLDHVNPVINPETGFVDWNTFINRLFVSKEGYQVLCKPCHKEKTHEKEKKVREEVRKAQEHVSEIEGQIYNNLQIIGFSHLTEKKYIKVLCDCTCGRQVIVQLNNLKSGHTKSCGCIAGTHKKSSSRVYKTWINIKSRCDNPSATGFKHYGGRGIENEWLSFDDFYADMGDPKENETLDRIDPNGNYSKNNCRWTTYTEQARNKVSYNHILYYDGQSKCISEWGEQLNIKPNTIYYRIKRGWTVGEALEFEERLK